MLKYVLKYKPEKFKIRILFTHCDFLVALRVKFIFDENAKYCIIEKL